MHLRMLELLPVKVVQILFAFVEQDASIKLVGGCVRDRILGIRPKDFDIATPCTPTEVKQDTGFFTKFLSLRLERLLE